MTERFNLCKHFAVVKGGPFDSGAFESIVPPDGDRVSFDQFQERAEEGVVERLSGGTAVGIGISEIESSGTGVPHVSASRWHVNRSG